MFALSYIFPQQKMFLNLLANVFAFREANFCFCNNVFRGKEVDKEENIDRKHISAEISHSLPRALVKVTL